MKLLDFLIEYNNKDIYPMHMPGHKRNEKFMRMVNPYTIDVTEAGELDNMHQPVGILKECIDKCGKVFGCKNSYFLINGSTGGILAAISAAVKKGGKILLSRGCHKSVYNAIYLRELQPIYIYPDVDESFGVYGSVSKKSVLDSLEENPDVELVVITSPTYEGIVSDIKSIADICHDRNIPLLVDSAHGAHFGFSRHFPDKSIALGADISVESIHKTLPAFTQTSILHFNSDLISEEKLRKFLTIYQTTSPSYVMMCGIDNCVEFINSNEGKIAFDDYVGNLAEFSQSMKNLKKIRILCKGNDEKNNHPYIFDFDIGKIVISVRNAGITGAELEQILLEEYKIQLEMSLGDYGIAMTSLCDIKEGFDRLANALLDLDKKLDENDKSIADNKIPNNEAPNRVWLCPKSIIEEKPSEAVDGIGMKVSRSKCLGSISQEYLYAYPPGIPIIVPGELITEEILSYVKKLENTGTSVYSTSNLWPDWINILQKVDE